MTILVTLKLLKKKRGEDMRRALIISLCVILSLFALSILIVKTVSAKLDRLTEHIISLPDNVVEIHSGDIEDISKTWEKQRQVLSTFVKKDYISSIDLALKNFKTCSLWGTQCEYLCAKNTLLISLKTVSLFLCLSYSSFL